MDELVTFGVLMGLESKRMTGKEDNNDVLLMFCSTQDLGDGRINITPRMWDLACMGFGHVAIARWCTSDTCSYVIFEVENLSKDMKKAISEDTEEIVRAALHRSDVHCCNHINISNN